MMKYRGKIYKSAHSPFGFFGWKQASPPISFVELTAQASGIQLPISIPTYHQTFPFRSLHERPQLLNRLIISRGKLQHDLNPINWKTSQIPKHPFDKLKRSPTVSVDSPTPARGRLHKSILNAPSNRPASFLLVGLGYFERGRWMMTGQEVEERSPDHHPHPFRLFFRARRRNSPMFL